MNEHHVQQDDIPQQKDDRRNLLMNELQSATEQCQQLLDQQAAAVQAEAEALARENANPASDFCYQVDQEYVMSRSFPWEKKRMPWVYTGEEGIRITEYCGSRNERVIVPSTINGLPVLCIDENAFRNSAVQEVVLPDSVRYIRHDAFRNCKQLRHIQLPASLTVLEYSCFRDSGLVELVFPRLHLCYSIPPHCCRGCRQLQHVDLGEQDRASGFWIENDAFRECSSLKEFLLPQRVAMIESGVFQETGIRTMIVPAQVEIVHPDAFYSSSFFTSTPAEPMVECVFLGAKTKISDHWKDNFTSFTNVSCIYGLPGSKVEEIAIKKDLPFRPLSEFDPKKMA